MLLLKGDRDPATHLAAHVVLGSGVRASEGSVLNEVSRDHHPPFVAVRSRLFASRAFRAKLAR